MPVPEHLHQSGLRVLVTRPQHQAAQFVEILRNAGMQTFELPCIDIAYRNPQTLSPTEKEKSQHSDWWIFTSANAVTGAKECRVLPPTNSNVKIAAIGQATCRALEQLDIRVDLAPADNSTSEQFLVLIKQQIRAGDQITIIRGDSGREMLKKSLQSRGAETHYLEVYQRLLPGLTATQAEELFTQAMPCVISITSDLGLSNLLKLLPATVHKQLLSCPLVVNSERCALLAKDLGFDSRIQVAHPPGDKGQLLTLSGLR